MPPHLDTLPYRRGAGIMLLNHDNHAFVGKRIDSSTQAWQMPQGGIDDGEAPLDTAYRELEEETGIHPSHVSLITQTPDWLHYDLPEALIPVIWNGQYRGQEQHWFLMRFHGSESDININTAIPEFSTWRWLPVDELPTLIVSFKEKLYQDIITLFSPHMSDS